MGLLTAHPPGINKTVFTEEVLWHLNASSLQALVLKTFQVFSISQRLLIGR